MDEERRAEFRIDRLPPYLFGEIARAVVDARMSGRDVIDLSQVNPSLGPPPLAVEKLVQASLHPHNHRYSSSQGISRLRQAICLQYGKRFGVSLDAEHEVVVSMGVKEGLAHLLLAVLTPGDTVFVPTPGYPIHAAAVFIAGANLVGIPIAGAGAERVLELDERSDDFFTRLDELYRRTWPSPRMMLLSFPHNPTTTTVTRGFFARLVAYARERQLFLVHDFAYADICFDGYRAPSLLEVDGAKDVSIECYSLSKGVGLPGWRMGFCLGNERLVSALKRIKSYLDFGIFQPLQIAASHALAASEDICREAAGVYQARRDVLAEELRRGGWEIQAPKATVFLWARMPDSVREKFAGEGSRSLALAQKLLRHADVAICPGIGFDRDADDFVRFALVENEQRLRLAAGRIDAVLTDISRFE